MRVFSPSPIRKWTTWLGAIVLMAVASPAQAGLHSRLYAMTDAEVGQMAPDVASQLDQKARQEPQAVIDLDKRWHGIHFVLTGRATEAANPPCGRAILGGTDLAAYNRGGSVRVIAPAEVVSVADCLKAIDTAMLRARYDAQVMTRLHIYPENIWLEEDDDVIKTLDWLIEGFVALRDFYARAAEQKRNVVIAIR